MINGLVLIFALTGSFNIQVQLEEEPVADQQVRLLLLSETQPREVQSATTNSNGMAKFALEFEEGAQVVGTSLYEGVSYFTRVLPADALEGKTVELEVHSVTQSTDALSVQSLSFFVDQRQSGVRVQQSFFLENSGRETIAGEDGKPVFSFVIPPNAYDLSWGEGFRRETLQFEGNRALLTGPFPPGQAYYSFRYQVDKPWLSFPLEQDFSVPVRRLEVALDSPELGLQGLDFKALGRKVYFDSFAYLYAAEPNQSQLSFRVSGLPLRLPLAWYSWILVLFLLVAFAFLLKPRTSRNLQTEAPGELLQELAQLERLYERGLVDALEYQSRKLKVLEKLLIHYPNKDGAKLT